MGIKFKLILSIIIIMIFILGSCTTSNKLIVNLIIKDEIADGTEYISIYSNGKSKKADKFEGDNLQVCNADPESFSSYISNNKVLNRLNKISLEDSQGNVVENDEIIIGIFQSAEKLEYVKKLLNCIPILL